MLALSSILFLVDPFAALPTFLAVTARGGLLLVALAAQYFVNGMADLGVIAKP